MRKEERDILDDLFRSKLQNFEADTTHDNWEAIVSRLPNPKGIPLRRRWPYWAAAAVVSLLIISSSLYWLQEPAIDGKIAKQIEQETQRLEPKKPETKDTPVWVATTEEITTPSLIRIQEVVAKETSIKESEKEETTDNVVTPTDKAIISTDDVTVKDVSSEPVNRNLESAKTYEYTSVSTPKKKEKKSSKWSFGAGAGGFTENAGNVVHTYALRSNSNVEDERLLMLNAVTDEGKLPKTNIKHKTPISFGLSVSRRLNDRFSLQTGVTYSMLTSDWETQGSVYNNKTRQRLHMVGVPLSISYKIAEWKRFNLYASAGAHAEVNVAGQERVKSYFEDKLTGTVTNDVRMKEWQWSTNARVGVSYPIIKYIHAYAEVGAAYYFDNGSDMETIYSDKSFNVSPQLGFRFSF